MRNITQYPLTNAEVQYIIKQQIKDINSSGQIGGIDALALTYVKEFLKDNKDFEEFLKKKGV